jgi:uroporphyrinogen-III synthase
MVSQLLRSPVAGITSAMVRQSRASPAPLVILTRPAGQGAEFAAQVARVFGADRVIVSPLMVTQYLPIVPRPAGFSALVLTSPAAVEAIRRDPQLLPALAYCVGARTAAEARALGLIAQSADGTAEDLLRLVTRAHDRGRVLYLHGQDIRVDLAAALNSAGIETVSALAYRQVPAPLSDSARAALAGDEPLLLPVFSPRSAQILLAEIAGIHVRAPLHFVAISPAAAAPLRQNPACGLTIASTPDAAGVLDAMQRVEWGSASD